MIDKSHPHQPSTVDTSIPDRAPVENPPESSSADPAPPNVPDLIPVRMLNEFSYCPRLSYLEWSQAEWADNLHTRQGSFEHRRVDQPTIKNIDSPTQIKEGETEIDVEQPVEIHARSLMLSAPDEGLLANLDLLELEGNYATPVDYKKGKAPDIPEAAYEPERVQLCAQGLILKENGFQCDHGILYFVASKKRVTIPFDDELIATTRTLAIEMRQMAANAILPAPLEDSPKCPGCSLVGICLPDETNLLQQRDSSQQPAQKPRRLIPANDNALPLYLQDYGLSLKKSGEQLIVAKKKETLQSVRILDVSQVSLFGNIYVTEPAVRELLSRGIPICHFSYGGWFYGMTTGFVHKNVELRAQQFLIAAQPQLSLNFARAFVAGKIKNSRTLLRRHLQDHDKKKVLNRIDNVEAKIKSADSMGSLLGLEGMAAKIYFAAFASLLKGNYGFSLENRNRRPPADPVNAMLSFLYAILTKELTVTLQAVGLDPMCGLYHQPRYGKPSLALDLAEEFRSIVVDSTVLTLVNNNEVTAESFINRAGSVAMTTAGRKAVLAAFERRMQTEVTHPIFGYRISYRRILEVQARLLARTISGELDQYPTFFTR